MFEGQIQSRIDELLADTSIKNLIVDELSRLCVHKPPEMSIHDYASRVASRVLLELHDRLHDECAKRGLAPPQAPIDKRQPVVDFDFEKIIQGLMMGMEHDLMVGNLQMVSALGGAIALRDTGTSEHNARVTLYAVRLGQQFGLDRLQLQSLIKGSFLHDIGKIGLPDNILLKQSGLTAEERELMESHVVRGFETISSVRWLTDACDVVRHHHEKFDGTGYPDRLVGEKIPLNARLFAIGDVFDALTSERPYKPAASHDDAIAGMKRQSGHHFDPDLFDMFVRLSATLYREITCCSGESLEIMVLKSITEVFGVNPASDYLATEEYRKQYGDDSIA